MMTPMTAMAPMTRAACQYTIASAITIRMPNPMIVDPSFDFRFAIPHLPRLSGAIPASCRISCPQRRCRS